MQENQNGSNILNDSGLNPRDSRDEFVPKRTYKVNFKKN